MNVGDYVRTIKGKIYKLTENDLKFEMTKQNCKISSPNIIDLIEVGDVIRYEIETPLETSGILKGVADVTDEEMLQNLKKDKAFYVKSIVTHEQFSQMEYKVE